MTYIAPIAPQTTAAYFRVAHCKSMPQGTGTIISERERRKNPNTPPPPPSWKQTLWNKDPVPTECSRCCRVCALQPGLTNLLLLTSRSPPQRCMSLTSQEARRIRIKFVFLKCSHRSGLEGTNGEGNLEAEGWDSILLPKRQDLLTLLLSGYVYS